MSGSNETASNETASNETASNETAPEMAPPPGLDRRQVLTDGTRVVVATVAGGAFLLLVNLYLARWFGPEEFGQLRILIALFSFVVVFIELGSGPSLVKYIAELPESQSRELTYRVLRLRAAGYLGLILLTLLFRDAIAGWLLKDSGLGGAVAAGAVFLAFFYFDVCKFLVLAYQRMRLYAASIAATYLANGVLAIAFAAVAGVPGAVAGWGLGYLVGNAWNLRFLVAGGKLRRGRPVDAAGILWRYGLPMQVEQGVRSLELAIVPLAGLFFAPARVGLLAFAMIFSRTVMVVATAFNSVLLPRFARLAADPERARSALRQAWLLITPLVALGAAAAVTAAEPVVAAIDPTYLAAVPLFRLLVVFSLASVYPAILISYYAGLGRVRPAVLVSAAQQLAMMAASFAGLVLWGAP